jgi:ABC-type Fe3+ transport system substrate-binding protein
MKNAPAPALAHRYLDFMLSSDGQEIMKGFGYEKPQWRNAPAHGEPLLLYDVKLAGRRG